MKKAQKQKKKIQIKKKKNQINPSCTVKDRAVSTCTELPLGAHSFIHNVWLNLKQQQKTWNRGALTAASGSDLHAHDVEKLDGKGDLCRELTSVKFTKSCLLQRAFRQGALSTKTNAWVWRGRNKRQRGRRMKGRSEGGRDEGRIKSRSLLTWSEWKTSTWKTTTHKSKQTGPVHCNWEVFILCTCAEISSEYLERISVKNKSSSPSLSPAGIHVRLKTKLAFTCTMHSEITKIHTISCKQRVKRRKCTCLKPERFRSRF